MISLDEYRRKMLATPPAQARIVELKGLAQEPPRMEALTGSETWDYYLRYIEAWIKAAEQMIEIERDRLANPAVTEHNALLAIKTKLIAMQSRAETLREVILLPKYLKDQGERAAEVVAKLEAGSQGAP